MGKNPFSNRTMIKNPDEFFGRKNELRTIFTRLSTLQSCDVYGERKIGKSSLLYYIFLKIREELGDDYKVAYIDLQDAHYHTVEDFLKNSLNEFGCKSEVINASNGLHKNLIAFTESIIELRKKEKPVLLIDEFESLTKKPEFNNDAFDAMRSLGTNGNIAYVTASLNSLKTLCTQGNLNSPFYNIFSEVPLSDFSPEETLEFLSAKRERGEFDEREKEFIYEIANNHPLHLQIACYHVHENKGKNWDEARLRKDIENEIKYLNALVNDIDKFKKKLIVTKGSKENKFLTVVEKWSQIIREENNKFAELEKNTSKEIPNPYIFGNPVRPDDKSRLFVGRLDVVREIETNLSNISQKPTLFLYGRRRVGKSSVLVNLTLSD